MYSILLKCMYVIELSKGMFFVTYQGTDVPSVCLYM